MICGSYQHGSRFLRELEFRMVSGTLNFFSVASLKKFWLEWDANPILNSWWFVFCSAITKSIVTSWHWPWWAKQDCQVCYLVLFCFALVCQPFAVNLAMLCEYLLQVLFWAGWRKKSSADTGDTYVNCNQPGNRQMIWYAMFNEQIYQVQQHLFSSILTPMLAWDMKAHGL